MSATTTIRLDAPLKRRITRLAQAAGRTPHSLMAEALEQKADELEAQAAFARLASSRDQAMQDGQQPVAWHDMKVWLRSNVKARVAAVKASVPKTGNPAAADTGETTGTKVRNK